MMWRQERASGIAIPRDRATHPIVSPHGAGMRHGTLATLATLVALTAAPAAGQGWVAQPGGEAGYAFPYNTSALFTCAVHAMSLGTCSTAPGSITYARPTGSLTLTFTGSAGTPTATSAGQLVVLGTLAPTFSGSGPFVVETSGFEWWPVFQMTVTGTGMGDYRAIALVQDGALVVSAATGQAGYLTITPPANPLGPSYPFVIIDQISSPVVTDATTGPVALGGQLSLVPEPSTYLMLGSGLLVLGGIGLRGRRRR